MSAKPKPMSQVKQILRLYDDGNSKKRIQQICNCSKNTVKKYIYLAEKVEESIDELLKLSDEELELRLLPQSSKPVPDRQVFLYSQMEYFISELNKTGVNRWRLWSEYRLDEPDGYSYSQFCDHLMRYRQQQRVSAPMDHEAGDKIYIDFTGKTMPYVDRKTGEILQAQIFVSAMGFSQLGYVRAVESQRTEDFIDALNHNLTYLGVVPKCVVPDNLKSAVIHSDRYEPKLNRVLEDWANHYGTVILPARPGKPRDKSLGENLVKHTYSHIFAPLRNKTFYSLGEMNQAIGEKLEEYNQKAFNKQDHSRLDWFVEQDKPVMNPLPTEVFLIKKYRDLTVGHNCHIELREDRHYYSVPMEYVRKKVRVIYTLQTVLVYHNHRQIACHPRIRNSRKKYTTLPDHLPSRHRQWLERSPGYYLRWAQNKPKSVQNLIKGILENYAYPEQAYKSCEGIRSLYRKAGDQILDQACQLALKSNQLNYTYVKTVIENNVYRQIEEPIKQKPLPHHDNIRGAAYYQQSLTFKTKDDEH